MSFPTLGFSTRLTKGSIKAQPKCWRFINLLLPYCLCLFAIVLCVSFANGLLTGCPRLLTALNPVLPVCSLCTAPLLLADQLPIGSPDKILGICRRNERRIKGWLLNTQWQRSGLLFSYWKPLPSSAAPLYIYLFSQRHHWEVQSATRNKGKSTSRSSPTKMLMSVEKEKLYSLLHSRF